LGDASEGIDVRNWFRTRPVTQPAGADTPDSVEAYREGRVDERRQVDGAPAAAAVATPSRRDLSAAYERGRDKERSRRRGSPFFSLIVLLAVVIAGAFLYLAIRNGSFSSGGAVVDRSLDQAAHTVDAPIKNAALKTGDALQKAGQDLK
jgi:hypothetical protein